LSFGLMSQHLFISKQSVSMIQRKKKEKFSLLVLKKIDTKKFCFIAAIIQATDGTG
jgi:hypothetical protein